MALDESCSDIGLLSYHMTSRFPKFYRHIMIFPRKSQKSPFSSQTSPVSIFKRRQAYYGLESALSNWCRGWRTSSRFIWSQKHVIKGILFQIQMKQCIFFICGSYFGSVSTYNFFFLLFWQTAQKHSKPTFLHVTDKVTQYLLSQCLPSRSSGTHK